MTTQSKNIDDHIDELSEANLRFVLKALIAADRVHWNTVMAAIKCADIIVKKDES